MMDDDEYDYFDEDFDRMRDYLKLTKQKTQIIKSIKQNLYIFNIRLSFDEVDKRCRRVPNDVPDIVPLSAIKITKKN